MSVASLPQPDPSLAAPIPEPASSTPPRRTRWVVERILKCRSIDPTNRTISLRAAAGHLECLEFLVHWEKCSESQRSWITVDNFADKVKSPMLIEFMQTKAITHFEASEERVPLSQIRQQTAEMDARVEQDLKVFEAMMVLENQRKQDKKAWEEYLDNVSLATYMSLRRLNMQRAAEQ